MYVLAKKIILISYCHDFIDGHCFHCIATGFYAANYSPIVGELPSDYIYEKQSKFEKLTNVI